MVPNLQKIDHIHINVRNRDESEQWYKEVLGLIRVESLEFWASDGGPLTLENSSKSIHVALFERGDVQNTAIAFKVSAKEMDGWLTHLANKGIDCEPIDHEVSWSIYFRDPDGNPFEITTYEYNEFNQ